VKTPGLVVHTMIGAAIVILSGCQPPPASKPEPPAVTVAKPIQQDVTDFAEFTGTLESTESQEIRARVQGFLQAAHFTDGATVEKDALLFVIEPEPFKAKLAAEQAKLRSAEAQLKLTQAQLDRALKLLPQRAISEEEVNIRTAERDVAAAAVLAARAAEDDAKINLGYTVMRAPITGRIGRRLVDPGNLVGGTQQTLLTTIVQLDPIYAYFDISEDIFNRYKKWKQKQQGTVREKSPVFIGLSDEEGFPHEGQIDFMDNRVDPATGTMLVRGIFPNKQGLLYPGLFVRIRIPLEAEKDAVLVHERAIGTDLSGKYVLVVDDKNIVHQRPVDLGGLQEGMRVIRKGLEPNESYIVDGLQFARPGLPAIPQPLDESAPETGPTGGAEEAAQVPPEPPTD